MKNIYRIFTIIFTTLILTSCSTSFNDIDSDHVGIIGFTSTSTRLISVSENSPEVSRSIPYFVSTTSSSERTFHVRVVPEETEVPSESYSFNPTIIIPANERSGDLIFTALNNGLTNEFTPVVLTFEEIPDLAIGNRMNIAIRTTD